MIDQVSKNYGNKQALTDFSLCLKPGVLGLLGPNGAGKTTLMKILATLMRATDGKVTLDGMNIVNNPKEIRKNLGYLPQDFGIYPNCISQLKSEPFRNLILNHSTFFSFEPFLCFSHPEGWAIHIQYM